MSTIYETTQGDTFDSISRKNYGVSDGDLIASANPAVSEDMAPGTPVSIPDRPAAPADVAGNVLAERTDEVAVVIAGEVFRSWESVSITRAVDQIDSFSLSAPSSNKLKPLSFLDAEVTVGGEPLFTGTLLDVQPNVSARIKMDGASGYAKPGVLNDCAAPAGTPVEFNNQSLEEIASTLLRPFGLSAFFESPAGAVFDQVARREDAPVLGFLAKLAAQRNLVIGSTPRGLLRFLTPEDRPPVVSLAQGQSPLVRVSPVFSPQDYYSEVTGIEPVIVGLKGQKHTVKNTRLLGVVRPYVFIVDDAHEGELKAVVETKAARMFGGAAGYTVEVATWRAPKGDLWGPGDTVELVAEDAKIFQPYQFLVRSVTFVASSRGKTASLSLVLPTVFSGKLPESMPWDE